MAIATEMVAKSEPDGYTCLMSSSSGLSLNPHVVEKLSRAIAEILSTRKVREQLESRELIAVGNTPAEFSAVIDTQSARWVKLIEAQNIKLD